jgi:hypothetical protein
MLRTERGLFETFFAALLGTPMTPQAQGMAGWSFVTPPFTTSRARAAGRHP